MGAWHRQPSPGPGLARQYVRTSAVSCCRCGSHASGHNHAVLTACSLSPRLTLQLPSYYVNLLDNQNYVMTFTMVATGQPSSLSHTSPQLIIASGGADAKRMQYGSGASAPPYLPSPTSYLTATLAASTIYVAPGGVSTFTVSLVNSAPSVGGTTATLDTVEILSPNSSSIVTKMMPVANSASLSTGATLNGPTVITAATATEVRIV